MKIFRGHRDSVTNVCANESLFSVSADGTVRQWELDLSQGQVFRDERRRKGSLTPLVDFGILRGLKGGIYYDKALVNCFLKAERDQLQLLRESR